MMPGSGEEKRGHVFSENVAKARHCQLINVIVSTANQPDILCVEEGDRVKSYVDKGDFEPGPVYSYMSMEQHMLFSQSSVRHKK
jgi:hypothetical protein